MENHLLNAILAGEGLDSVTAWFSKEQYDTLGKFKWVLKGDKKPKKLRFRRKWQTK